MAGSLAYVMALDMVWEEFAEDEVAEQIVALVGDVYDPTVEFR
jgi:hypothetical protein